MLQIRRNVFETNSSSCHSLTFSKNCSLSESDLMLDDDKNIIIYSGGFGWEEEILCSQSDKLDYLFTSIRYFDDENYKTPTNSKYYKWLTEMLKDYTGCDCVVESYDEYYPYGYIDHESTNNLWEIFSDNEDEFKLLAKYLIFGGSNYITTDNDNH